MRENEEWKYIKDYEGLYMISNYGNIKSFFKNKKGKLLIPQEDKDGYLKIKLSNKGKVKNKLIHQLVAEAFIPNPLNLKIINHKNCKRNDNYVDNLEWCDVLYNNRYSWQNTDRKPTLPMLGKTGIKNHFSKKVIQYDLEMNFIKEWGSVHDIQRELGFLQGNISTICRNKKGTAYGFIWRYKEIN